MSAHLSAELSRCRQQEIAAAAMYSEHRRELLAARRAPRRSVRSLLPRIPRFEMARLAAGGRAR